MAEKITLEELKALAGKHYGTSDWIKIDQKRIDAFAECTNDWQFIHIDPEKAAQTPFGGTIAHGFLTLSMLTHLAGSVPQDPETVKGVIMGVNYGFDKVRFVSPVPSGAKIRATSALKDVQLKDPNNIQVTRTYTVEVEGAERPAVVADWITRLTYA